MSIKTPAICKTSLVSLMCFLVKLQYSKSGVDRFIIIKDTKMRTGIAFVYAFNFLQVKLNKRKIKRPLGI